VAAAVANQEVIQWEVIRQGGIELALVRVAVVALWVAVVLGAVVVLVLLHLRHNLIESQ
jgi:hypothetical protein